MSVCSVVAAGCSERDAAVSTTAPIRPSLSVLPELDTTDLVLTPNGYYHRGCTFEVPEGATLRDGVITRRDGTSYNAPTCLNPGPVGGGIGAPAASQRRLVVPGYHGWPIYGYAWTSVGQTIRHLAARWVVPQRPAAYTSGTNFLFPGAQNGYAIIQPVLQYGPSNAGGGNYWTIGSWICGATCPFSPLQTVNVGDVLGGTVDASNCFDGGCNWTITIVDSTLGRSSTLYEAEGQVGHETDDAYNFAVGGAHEIANLTGCYQLTGGPHAFTQLAFTDNSGNTFAPSWYRGVDTSATPKCEYGEASTGSAIVTLTDSLAPVLTTTISGPSGVPQDSSGTWYASLGLPGTSPYTYNWTGVYFSGTASSITAVPSASGYLTLRVIDAAADTAYDSLYVTVCAPGQLTC